MSFNPHGNIHGNSVDYYFRNAMDPSFDQAFDDPLSVEYNEFNSNDLSQISDNAPQYGFAEANRTQGQVQTFNDFPAPHVAANYQNQQAHSGYGPQLPGPVNYQTVHNYSGAGTAVAPISYQNNYASSEGSAQSSQQRRASNFSEPTEASSEQSQSAPKKGRKSRSTKKILTEAEEDAKRKIFLERNRTAASKCRMRKKEMGEELKRKYKDIQEENNDLRRQLALKTQDFETAKAVLYRLSHDGCQEPIIARWVKMDTAKAFDRVSIPQQPSNSMQRRDSFEEKYRRMIGEDETQSVSMSRLNSSQSRMVETMSSRESINSQRGDTKMSPQVSSQSSRIETPLDSGISNMGSPDKIKPEAAKSPFNDEGYSGQPMMQNQRLPQVMVGGLQRMDNPAEYLARTGISSKFPQYPPRPT